jgi:DNA polymerase epsilon subunit 2
MTPIYWSFDHALHLYPLPDLIVVCDKFKSITDTIADCTIINPVNINDFNKIKLIFFLFE